MVCLLISTVAAASSMIWLLKLWTLDAVTTGSMQPHDQVFLNQHYKTLQSPQHTRSTHKNLQLNAAWSHSACFQNCILLAVHTNWAKKYSSMLYISTNKICSMPKNSQMYTNLQEIPSIHPTSLPHLLFPTMQCTAMHSGWPACVMQCKHMIYRSFT